MTTARSRFESISGILAPRQPAVDEGTAADRAPAAQGAAAVKTPMNPADRRNPAEQAGIRDTSHPRTGGQGRIKHPADAAHDSTSANAAAPNPQKRARRSGQKAAAAEAKPAASRPHQRPAQAPADRDSDAPGGQPPAGPSRRIAFRLAPELHAALITRTRESDNSRADVVLDLVEKAVSAGRLQAIIDSYTSSPAPSGGLFPRLQGRRPAEPAIPTEIRVAPEAVQILDELVERHGASSRTHLLSAVVADAFTN